MDAAVRAALYGKDGLVSQPLREHLRTEWQHVLPVSESAPGAPGNRRAHRPFRQVCCCVLHVICLLMSATTSKSVFPQLTHTLMAAFTEVIRAGQEHLEGGLKVLAGQWLAVGHRFQRCGFTVCAVNSLERHHRQPTLRALALHPHMVHSNLIHTSKASLTAKQSRIGQRACQPPSAWGSDRPAAAL